MKRSLVPVLLVLALVLMWLGPVLRAPTTAAVGGPETHAPFAFADLQLGVQALGHPFGVEQDIGWPGSRVEVRRDVSALVVFGAMAVPAGRGPGALVFAWNGVHALFLMLGGLGCVVLARELDEDERDRVTNGANDALVVAVFCGSATAWSLPAIGRTDLLPALVLPLALALLHKTLRTNRWEHAAGAGLALAVVALGGPRTALFAGLVTLPAALAWTRRWHDDWAKTGVVLGLGALGLAPSILGGLDVSAAAPQAQDAWPVLASLRADPAQAMRGLERAAYPGFAALALGLFGQRRGLAWAGLGLGLLALGFGPFLLLPGGEMPGPAWPLAGLGVTDWNHLGLFAALCAALAAHAGWRRLTSWFPWVRMLWFLPVGIALADGWTTGPDTPTWSPRPPEALSRTLSALPPGAVVHLPVGDDAVLAWQPSHGRPISAVPGGDTLAEDLELLRLIDRQTPLGPEPIQAVQRDAVRLQGMGAAALILDHDADDGRIDALLTAALGPGQRDGRFSAWSL